MCIRDRLDSFTIREVFPEVRGKRVLIVGDILHSRVARSTSLLMKRLGMEAVSYTHLDVYKRQVAFRAFAVVAADLPVWFSAVADRENNVDRIDRKSVV